jgi:maltose O-acetyltransferase
MSSIHTATSARAFAELVAIVGSFARARILLRGARLGARIRCYGNLITEDRTGLDIGPKAVFLRGPIAAELRCDKGAELAIGASTVVNHGVSILANRSVRIGARCLLAPLVHVRDDDGRHMAPVTIGDDVWLAHGAIVEPGSVIGDGSVVATMSVVSSRVPPHSLVAGNPAQCFPLESSTVEERSTDASRPSREEIRSAIIEWLDDTRHFGAAASLVPSDSASLVAAGLLDSLGLVELAHMLEERFGITIDPKRTLGAGQQTIQGFLDLVAAREAALQ